MKSSASKIKMTSYDDLFETDTNTNTSSNSSDDNLEKIQHIPIKDLMPFNNHPFKVLVDEKMEETKESIEKYGVLVPIIARPKSDGKYEIIAGHRRKRACELLEIETIPTITRDLDDEESTIIMVDSNIQRENLLYSEKAFAFKMKLDAVKRKAGRPKNNSDQVGLNFEKGQTSTEVVADEAGESQTQIKRYIRLTELNVALLEMVDDKKLAFNTGVELSYLTKEEQEMLLSKVEELEIIPSMVQAAKLKKYSSDGTLTDAVIDVILLENTEKPIQVTLKANKLNKYFSKDCSSQEIEETIMKLLEEWQNKRK